MKATTKLKRLATKKVTKALGLQTETVKFSKTGKKKIEKRMGLR